MSATIKEEGRITRLLLPHNEQDYCVGEEPLQDTPIQLLANVKGREILEFAQIHNTIGLIYKPEDQVPLVLAHFASREDETFRQWVRSGAGIALHAELLRRLKCSTEPSEMILTLTALHSILGLHSSRATRHSGSSFRRDILAGFNSFLQQAPMLGTRSMLLVVTDSLGRVVR